MLQFLKSEWVNNSEAMRSTQIFFDNEYLFICFRTNSKGNEEDFYKYGLVATTLAFNLIGWGIVVILQ